MEEEIEKFIKIPKNRVGVLIGEKGVTRKDLESQLKVKLIINSESGDVEIQSRKDATALDVYLAEKVVNAIGRGFAPHKAFLLVNDDMAFDLIDLREELGKNKKMIESKKARIIGKEGLVREKIERETNCFISVYGHTIAFIGNVHEIAFARKIVDCLLDGATHENAFKVLAKNKKEDLTEW